MAAKPKTKSSAKPETARHRPGPRSKPLVSVSSMMLEWNDQTIRALREHLRLTQGRNGEIAEARGRAREFFEYQTKPERKSKSEVDLSFAFQLAHKQHLR